MYNPYMYNSTDPHYRVPCVPGMKRESNAVPERSAFQPLVRWYATSMETLRPHVRRISLHVPVSTAQYHVYHTYRTYRTDW